MQTATMMTASETVVETPVLPAEDWTLDQLKTYAVERMGSLRAFARKTAQETWKVGRALSLIQPKIKRKKGWMTFVKEELGISYNTANNLIKIGKAFDNLDELEGWTVAEIKRYLEIYPEEQSIQPDPVKDDRMDESLIAGGSEPRDEVLVESQDPTPDSDASDEQDQDPEQTLIDQFDAVCETISHLATDAPSHLKTRLLDADKIKTAIGNLHRLAEFAGVLEPVAA